jgi:ribosomal-protein-alanine N-acetyltransferase
MQVTIRLASEHDAADIAALSRSAIEHGLPWSWHPHRVAAAIADPDTNVIVARGVEALIGFGIMEYEDETAHLVLFAVDGPARRIGLGSRLLAWLEKVAATGGIGEIRVEARADNAAAIAFYEKHGYTEQAGVPGMYYGAEDGVRLVKRLGTNPSS